MSVEPPKAVVAAAAVLPRGWGAAVVAHLAVARAYTVLPQALLTYGIAVHAGAAPLHAVSVTVAVACAVAGGYAYNDLRDQQLDRLNRPRRPIVSGRLSEHYVRRLVHALFGGALAIALATRSWRTIAFTSLLIVSSVIYSDVIKSVPGIKNLFVGLWCGALPYGAALDVVQAAAVLPAITVIALFITQKELVADVYDLDGDVAAGLRTVPAIAGARGALSIVALLNLGSLLFVRLAGPADAIPGLSTAATIVACVNVAALSIVLCWLTRGSVRAYLELQKVFLIGGCVALFALLGR